MAQVRLATARVAEALAEHARHVEVDQQQVLLEGAALAHQLAVGIEHQARAVEDQLILPADHVDVGHDGAVVGGARGQHLLAEARLLIGVRRGVDVDDDLGARQALGVGRTHGVPDVLAYVDAQRDVAEAEDGRLPAGSEVAVLVEDAIRRQELLVVDVHDLDRDAVPRRR